MVHIHILFVSLSVLSSSAYISEKFPRPALDSRRFVTCNISVWIHAQHQTKQGNEVTLECNAQLSPFQRSTFTFSKFRFHVCVYKTHFHWIVRLFYLTRIQATFRGCISYAIKMAKLTLLVCFSICLSSMVAEPQCSPFHYHEQLLEKMIAVQYKMGINSEKMEKWESAINEKLSKLEDKMEQQAQLEKKLTATVNDTLAEASEFKVNLRKELLDLQGTVFLLIIVLYSRHNSRIIVTFF